MTLRFCRFWRSYSLAVLRIFAQSPPMPLAIFRHRVDEIVAEQARDVPFAAGLLVRSFAGEPDEELWLNLINGAFAREGRRAWGRPEFARELTARAWFAPGRLLFAIDQAQPDDVLGTVSIEPPVGTHSVARVARLHWLAVRADARRRGVGWRLVAAAAEQACGLGAEWIEAETAVSQIDAVKFYESVGFERIR